MQVVFYRSSEFSLTSSLRQRTITTLAGFSLPSVYEVVSTSEITPVL
jgi:hypothetical protein